MSGNGRHTPWYAERLRAQVEWKRTTNDLPPDAKAPGMTMIEVDGIRRAVGPFPVCLPLERADHNLVEPIRREAVARFRRGGIAWHDWTDAPDGGAWPSSHLLSSQVQCVNVLLSLEAERYRLLAWVRTLIPDAMELVPVEGSDLVAFEWAGPDGADFLHERPAQRVRGKYQTSPDAVLLVRRPTGTTVLVVEWKDTEFYPFPVEVKPWRRRTYGPLVGAPESPLLPTVPFEAYFQEPHYQLMRLHLLASEFLRRLPAVDNAKVVHIMPTGNSYLRELVPVGLRALGRTVDEVWSKLLRPGCGVDYALVHSDGLLSATPHLARRYAAAEPRCL
jgi:hypothetical protein